MERGNGSSEFFHIQQIQLFNEMNRLSIEIEQACVAATFVSETMSRVAFHVVRFQVWNESPHN